MQKLTILVIFLSLCFGLGATIAEDDKKEEKSKPQPDLFCSDVGAPEGIVMGADNQVKAIITNLNKDSDFEGTVKVELVVIQADPTDRDSYFVEVDAMGKGTKREAIFTGVQAKNPDSVRLLVKVDPEEAVEETNENNNRRLYKAWIKSPNVEPSPTASPEPEK